MKAAKRVGVVVPSSNVVIEPELSGAMPDSATIHFTRAWYRFGSLTDPRPLEPLPAMAEDTIRAVPVLADAGVRIISSGSTAGSFFAGTDFERELIERMEAQAEGVVATTPASAVVAALRALGATSVSVITPYMEPLYAAERAYLEAKGFSVANAVGIEIAHGRDMAYIDPAELDRFVRANVDPDADVCFVSCTNLRTFEWIERWEEEFGRPVVTSNQAMLWMLLGLAGADDRVEGLGRLLAAVDRQRTTLGRRLVDGRPRN
jgi:maleate isomerase